MHGKGFVTEGVPSSDFYRPRRRLLANDQGLVGVLRYYDSAVTQPIHAHDRTQVSFLLLGSMRETQGTREYVPAPGSVGFKPAGCMHADRFGRDGALILAIETDGADAPDRDGWSVHDDEMARVALTRLAVDTCGSALAAETMRDLLASAGQRTREVGQSVPPALRRAREQIHEQPDECRIDALAAGAGFERTHFAQLFRRHFGLPPSLYRAKRMTAKATRALLTESRTIADAAFAAGFADHSHFTKTLRRFTGMSPQQLRSALR
jgi:AraC-like DNA-binding protein